MKKYLMLWVLMLSLFIFFVWVLILDEVCMQGWVGEMLNGYLVVLKNDVEIQKLVFDINYVCCVSYQQLVDSNYFFVDEVVKMVG